jgi:hypothetical protein
MPTGTQTPPRSAIEHDPFCPEPLPALRRRLPAAFATVYRRRIDGSLDNPPDYSTATLGRHAFDFEAGVRIVAMRERWVGVFGGVAFLTFTATLDPGSDLWRDLTALPVPMAADFFVLHAQHAIESLCPWIPVDKLRFKGFHAKIPVWFSFVNPPKPEPQTPAEPFRCQP